MCGCCLSTESGQRQLRLCAGNNSIQLPARDALLASYVLRLPSIWRQTPIYRILSAVITAFGAGHLNISTMSHMTDGTGSRPNGGQIGRGSNAARFDYPESNGFDPSIINCGDIVEISARMKWAMPSKWLLTSCRFD